VRANLRDRIAAQIATGIYKKFIGEIGYPEVARGDAGIGTPAAVCVKVARTGDAISQVSKQSSVTLPISAHRIPVAIVPFCPPRRKVPDLKLSNTQSSTFSACSE